MPVRLSEAHPLPPPVGIYLIVDVGVHMPSSVASRTLDQAGLLACRYVCTCTHMRTRSHAQAYTRARAHEHTHTPHACTHTHTSVCARQISTDTFGCPSRSVNVTEDFSPHAPALVRNEGAAQAVHLVLDVQVVQLAGQSKHVPLTATVRRGQDCTGRRIMHKRWFC